MSEYNMSEWDDMHDFEDNQKGGNAADELNTNKLLPAVKTRDSKGPKDGICFSDASEFKTIGSNGLGLSPGDAVNESYKSDETDAFSTSIASERNLSNNDENMQTKTYHEGKEENSPIGITSDSGQKERMEEEQKVKDALNFEEDISNDRKELDSLAEKSYAEDQEECARTVLERIETGIENISIQSIECSEKKDSLYNTLNTGEVGDERVDIAPESAVYSEILQAKPVGEEGKPVNSNNNNFEEIPANYEYEKLNDRELSKEKGEKTGAIRCKEINECTFESDRRDDTASCNGSHIERSISGTLNISDESHTSTYIPKDNFDEEDSEYLSAASHRFSSTESLDDAFIKKANRPEKDILFKNDIEMEAGARSIHGSEADRTEDDYVTCDEHSTAGGDGQADEDHYGVNQIQNCVSRDEVLVTDSSVNGFDDDCEGYETQEYVTADEESEFDEGADNTGIVEEEEIALEKEATKEDLIDTSLQNVVHFEESNGLEATDAEEYATADEEIKEDEDDRSTIVGSDNEGEENSKEFGDEINSEGMWVNSESLSKTQNGPSLSQEKVDGVDGNSRGNEKEAPKNGCGINKEENTNVLDIDSGEKKPARRKKSFFSSIMAKKETKIAERLFNYNQRYEVAMEGIAQANTRFNQAKSDLPLMIIEKRIPKVEELQRKSDKLEKLKTRLESYIEYNKSINAVVQNWRTTEGSVHDKKAEFQRCSNKTSERQRLLMACKKRQSFLHSELTRQDDIQLHKKRRIQQLTDRLDMLNLRQTEQRNLVKRRIDEAKKYCEQSVREAAKVVVASKRLETLKVKEKELEDKLFNGKKELKNARQKRKEKEFEVERANIQKSVKAMKKERGW